jgi:glycosyltransferase involved in cell wall biosynthesis
VASRTGGIPEQITDGESGMLVDLVGPDGHHAPQASRVLADAVVQLITNVSVRMRLGCNARKRILECFSERRLGDELVAIFQNLYRTTPC